jgi:hypothetical protein
MNVSQYISRKAAKFRKDAKSYCAFAYFFAPLRETSLNF